MASNKAAYLPHPHASNLQVQEAPYPTPLADEVIIQTAAIALNPLDWKIQAFNPPVGGRALTYPLILGSDVAGTVVEVGSAVTQRKVGDSVISHVFGVSTGNAANSAFQQFVSAKAHFTIPIPAGSVDVRDAVVLPLASDTAAAAVFGRELLACGLAGLEGSAEQRARGNGETVLIWGGSSSVGCCAIQMARAAGYEVFTTASPRNHELCRQLGASGVFDHSSGNVVEEVVAALQGKKLVGAVDCISDGEKTMPLCAQILAKAGANKLLATVLAPPTESFPGDVTAKRVALVKFIPTEEYQLVHRWIERSLADGSLLCKPDAKVVGNGLEFIQAGMDMLKKGVSASKLVVTL